MKRLKFFCYSTTQGHIEMQLATCVADLVKIALEDLAREEFVCAIKTELSKVLNS